MVSPAENAVARVISGGEPTLIFLVSNILTGTAAVGAVSNPVPKLVTSTPVIDPIPEDDQPRKVAFAPSAVTPVRVVFALLRFPVITCPEAKDPEALEIVILPGCNVTIVAVEAGDASLVIISPTVNVPEVVSEDELKVNLLDAGVIVGINS